MNGCFTRYGIISVRNRHFYSVTRFEDVVKKNNIVPVRYPTHPPASARSWWVVGALISQWSCLIKNKRFFNRYLPLHEIITVRAEVRFKKSSHTSRFKVLILSPPALSWRWNKNDFRRMTALKMCDWLCRLQQVNEKQVSQSKFGTS